MKVPLDDLNPEQREAVERTEGPLLILAGAGSGKTRVITRRIAYLVEERGVRPGQIFAVTFTNKAANEMKNRVAELVGERAQRILVGTFHSACARFLRQDAHLLGYTRTFTIYDDDDQTRLLKQIAGDLKINVEKYPASRLRWSIDQAKNRLMSPEDLARSPLDGGRGVDLNDPAPQVYAAYQRALQVQNAVDFNDILNLTVKLLDEHPDVAARYHDRFRYLMVDEYQDTNPAQYKLIRLMAGEGRPNLAVVGDDDQSIYAFRGADIGNILNFDRDYPNSRIVLMTNYRSTKNIFKAATSVVKNNPHRLPGKDEIEAAGPVGEPVRLLTAETEQEEADMVVREIRWLARQGYSNGDIAIIFRTNAASRAFEQALTFARINHVLVGGRRFFDREEIRDMLAYLRLVLNPADEMSFLRAIGAPSRGVGPKALDAIRAEAATLGAPLLEGLKVWASVGGKSRAGGAAFVKLIRELQALALAVSPSELVARVIETSGYAAGLRADNNPVSQTRLENLEELVRAVEQAVHDGEQLEDGPTDPLGQLQAFLDRAALVAGSDELPDEGGHVTLLTAHLAKGLEYPVVFVTGMVEGSFPHFRSLEAEKDIAEERRLVYVACTRARNRLYVSRSRFRLGFDKDHQRRMRPADPSRFLAEIDRLVLAFGSASAASIPRPNPPSASPSGRVQSTRGTAPTQGGLTLAQVLGMPARKEPVAPAEGEALRTMVPESVAAFQPGVEVMHPTYGRGVVKERQGAPSNPKLVVHFDRFGRRTVIATGVRMEIVLS